MGVIKIGEIMTKSVVTLPKGAKLMAERSISCIVIVDDRNKPIGIVTERDIVKRVLFANADPNKVILEDVMSSPVVTAGKDIKLMAAMKLMRENSIRRLVIIEKSGELNGLPGRKIRRASRSQALARLSGPGSPEVDAQFGA